MKINKTFCFKLIPGILLVCFSNYIKAQSIDSIQTNIETLTIKKNEIINPLNPGLITTFSQLISGKIAGLQAFSDDGSIFSNSNIIGRGTSSVLNPNQALVVIDGVPLDATVRDYFLNRIRPQDIEYIQMVYDPVFTDELAGAFSNNGVILIRTKQGSAGKHKINFNSTNAIQQNTRTASVLSADEFRQLITNSGNGNLIGLLGQSSTNWLDEIFQTAPATMNHLSLTGEFFYNIPFRASGSYLNQSGTLQKEHSNQYQYNLNINPSFWQNYLKINFNLGGDFTQNTYANKNAISYANYMDPTQSVYDSQGNFWEWNSANSFTGRNPIAFLDYNNISSTLRSFQYRLSADYQTHFLPDLHLIFKISDFSYTKNENLFIPKGTPDNWGKGLIQKTQELKGINQSQLSIKYSKNILKHQFGFEWGYLQKKFRLSGFENSQTIDGLQPDSSEYFSNYSMVSFYESAHYSFEEKYSVFVSAAHYFSPRYSKILPAVKLYWNIEKENFFNSRGFINKFGLNISYSTNTEEKEFPSAYLSYIEPKNESIRQWNAGLDFACWDNHISGFLNLYHRNTDDFQMIIDTPTGSNSNLRGIAGVGGLSSDGADFNIHSELIRSNKLNWNLGFNASYQKTIVKSFKYKEYWISTNLNAVNKLIKPGYEPYSFLAYEQTFDSNGKPLSGFPGYDKLYAKHSPSAKFLFGLNSILKWKNWTSDVSLRANLGNYVYNYESAAHGCFSPNSNKNFLSNIHSDYFNTDFKTANLQSDYYIQNASFLKLDYLNIMYDFGKVTKLATLRIAACVQNVFTLTAYKGVEPEIYNGVESGFYPHPRIYSINLNLEL